MGKRMSDEINNDDIDLISKSQQKEELLQLKELGQQLLNTKLSDRQNLPLPEKLIYALDEMPRIKSHIAKKRQMQFIAKLLRSSDVEAIEAGLDTIKENNHRSAKHKPYVNQWVSQFLAQPKETLQQFIARYPHANIQKLRQSLRAAQKEQEHSDAMKNKLFRVIRDEIKLSDQN